jgi:uncharacterized membrane protein
MTAMFPLGHPLKSQKRQKLLLVGESWVSTANHVKGWDSFSSITFHLGAEPLVKALQDSPFELTYMKAHDAATDFPSTLAGLKKFLITHLAQPLGVWYK